MDARGFIVTLSSENPDRLRASYEGVVGLHPVFDFAPGAFAMDASSTPSFIVEEHSEVRGRAKEPQRLLLNLVVGDVATEEARLRSHLVESVRDASVEDEVGVFATFVDPDGNYCQLVQLYE
ncbi:MAG: VOC family protein [Dehalococcoidia bacterium]|nr:VOC family protein [Dehalococcoidia bacterium]